MLTILLTVCCALTLVVAAPQADQDASVKSYSNDVQLDGYEFAVVRLVTAINTVYQTLLTTYMMNPGRSYQVNSYDELTTLGYDLALTDDENIYRLYGDIIPQNNLKMIYEEHVLLYALEKANTAMFLDELYLIHYYNGICSGNLDIKFHKIPDKSFSVYHHLVFTNPRIVSKVSQLLRRIEESGLTMKVANDIANPTGISKWTLRSTELKETYFAMSVSHFKIAFIFLLFAHVQVLYSRPITGLFTDVLFHI
ncbi:hypothetical protein C0J52_22588 [Blattella germanica]|nr:hypothetical protein C0J52_22588 [Blattella germanica]